MRGRKPKPLALRLIEGNPGKRALPVMAGPLGGPLGPPPDYLSDHAAEIYMEVRRLAWWLTTPHCHKAGVFATLAAEFEENPVAFSTSRIRLLSAFGSDLGLGPAARASLIGVRI